MFSGATRPVVTPSAMNTRGRWSAACIQVVTTLARTGPMRRWRRWSAKPVQAASSHQLMSAKAMTAPSTALMRDGRIRGEGDDRRGAGEDEGRGEGRAGEGDERDDVPARADPEAEDPAAQLADAAAAIGEGGGDEGRDDEGHRGQEDERGGAGQVEVDDPEAGV